MSRFVILLRGINVGGKNLVPMPALKVCIEELGMTQISTYIQSGNVLLTSQEPPSKLTSRIEKALSERFRYSASVVVRSQKQLKATIEEAPRGFGSKPDRYRYDVIFLKEDLLPASSVLKQLPRNPEVDQIAAGPGAIYFSRLISKASKSRLSRVVSMPIYQSMTIRNWRTTTTLLERLDHPT